VIDAIDERKEVILMGDVIIALLLAGLLDEEED